MNVGHLFRPILRASLQLGEGQTSKEFPSGVSMMLSPHPPPTLYGREGNANTISTHTQEKRPAEVTLQVSGTPLATDAGPNALLMLTALGGTSPHHPNPS